MENQLPGALEWSRFGRKTANQDAQWTCRCSTNMLFVKHITPNPRFTKQRWYLQGPRRQLLMLLTGITVYQSEKKIATPPRSSRHRVGTEIKLVHRATLLHRTDTPEDSTRLSMTSPTKPNASMTHAYGQTLSKKASFKHVVGICGRHGIVQNPEKFVFGSDTVEFAGFVITPTDIQPSDKHIRAIRDFPTPQNITDFRSWFGLINQVSYCDSLRNDMAPFREHLKPSSTFYWDDQLQQVFEQSKAAILDKITEGVRIFDSKRVTCLATDWSRNASVFGSCRSTAPVRSSLLSVAQRDGK